MQTEFTISTQGPGLYEFTPDVRHWLNSVGGDGVLTLFVRHTSCSLVIQENADPEVQTDLRAFFDRLVPPSDHPAMAYLRHTYEGPDDMPAHIKAALLPVSLSISGCVRAAGSGYVARRISVRTPRCAASPKGCCAFRVDSRYSGEKFRLPKS